MRVVDSHTGGEPTRVVLEGGPDLGDGPLSERAEKLATTHQAFYQSVILEPRGQPAMVGALLVEPTRADCVAGVIYFDAAAVIGMCGHGTIGLAVTLARLGRIDIGAHKIETPVGVVTITLQDANTVTVTNVESRRVERAVQVPVPKFGSVTGDIAYGGNWFFIVDPSPVPIEKENIRTMTDLAISIRDAVKDAGHRGDGGQEIDHVIFQSASSNEGVRDRNFVLCPDGDYDRSPCGTGSSARLACLAADGALAPGEEMIQESVIGSRYRLNYQPGAAGGVIASITGQAYIMAHADLVFEDGDPFRQGIL